MQKGIRIQSMYAYMVREQTGGQLMTLSAETWLAR